MQTETVTALKEGQVITLKGISCEVHEGFICIPRHQIAHRAMTEGKDESAVLREVLSTPGAMRDLKIYDSDIAFWFVESK